MMKTIKTKVLVVVFLLGTFVNFANRADVSNVLNTKNIKLVFNEVKKGHLLTIKDKDGTIIRSETVSKPGLLAKVFDLSSLSDGTYTIELNKDFEIIVKTLEVKNRTVIFNENSKIVIFKPVIRNEENILMISKIAFDKKPSKISLYYNDEIIYSETIKSEMILNRAYKLDKDEKGDYKVVIYNNKRSYVHNFKI
ncbi:hypothetical protein ATE90_0061 [Polaribacter sp. Hel1_33_96]|nr:hypothetical protein PHEL49_0066 [Polaribacter sp. Hel1_33_49]PKV63695.1 hypothetical protein ATE90_0061 [Polaribacter sp. Hel1_33_96]